MSETTIHQPHDGFFKHSLSSVTVAKDFLQAHLSPSITQRIQWDTLKMTNRSYVNQKLAQLHSDVVYTCQLDQKSAYIYLLIEQQTKPDPLLPFRFLEYNVSLLKEHIAQREEKDKKKPLPVVINLCLYSGKKTPYPHSVDIYDCFKDPALARAELFKPLSLIDLGQMSEEELKQHGTAALMELLLKQARYRTFLKWIKAHAEEVRQLLDEYYGIGGIHYILGVENKHSSDEIIEAIIALSPHKQENIMTALQQLEQKGRQEGRQEGMHTKSLEIAKNMLSNMHLDIQTVSQATGLSQEDLMKLQEEAKR